jgi:hypothetical protein
MPGTVSVEDRILQDICVHWVQVKGQWCVFWLVSYAESARNYSYERKPEHYGGENRLATFGGYLGVPASPDLPKT